MTGIINYGAGNIYSVITAVKKCGEETFIINKPDDFSTAQRIILPGVGAFGDGIESLEKRGLKEKLIGEINSGKPFLGICLGLQLLFSTSEEGGCPGFELIKGEVKQFRLKDKTIKVPHMGWNKVKEVSPEEKLFSGIPRDSYFYFAHSYYAVPDEENVSAGVTFYGLKFTSVIKRRNIAGVQFHPEKSGDYGIVFIKNFLEGKWLL